MKPFAIFLLSLSALLLLLLLLKLFSTRLLNLILFPRRTSRQNPSLFTSASTHLFLTYSVDSFLSKKIPTLFLPYKHNEHLLSSKALLYFHGNGEDLGESLELLNNMRRELKTNVFALEYPGYGVNKVDCSNGEIHEVVKAQALGLYGYVKEVLGFEERDIVVVGRSIGSGPACHVAARTASPTLILISPYYSIRSMIREKSCFLLPYLFAEPFPNDENIEKSKARLMVIHGENDEVISYRNTQKIKELYEGALKRKGGEFWFREGMTHNQYNQRVDIIEPMKEFLGRSAGKGSVDESLGGVNIVNEEFVMGKVNEFRMVGGDGWDGSDSY